MYGGLDWKQRLEAAALPRDILHSVGMSAWKESGQWWVLQGSDGFHFTLTGPVQAIRSRGYDLRQFFIIWKSDAVSNLRRTGQAVLFLEETNDKKRKERKFFLTWLSLTFISSRSTLTSLVANYVWAAAQVMHCCGICWGAVTLDLLSWLSAGDHGGQLPYLWWLFSHNHVCFWRHLCFHGNQLPN